MLARFIERPIDVIDGCTTKVFLWGQARDYSFGVPRLAILIADGRKTGVAACLFALSSRYNKQGNDQE